MILSPILDHFSVSSRKRQADITVAERAARSNAKRSVPTGHYQSVIHQVQHLGERLHHSLTLLKWAEHYDYGAHHHGLDSKTRNARKRFNELLHSISKQNGYSTANYLCFVPRFHILPMPTSSMIPSKSNVKI
jgi:hypothetical protein